MQEEANSFRSFTEGFGSPSDERRGARDALNMPGAMERADSSPNLQDMGSEGPPLSPAEKRRNKLGYHRTAVACGQLSCTRVAEWDFIDLIQAIAEDAKFVACPPSTIQPVDARIASG